MYIKIKGSHAPCDVTRNRSRGAGYGLVIPCEYSLYGPKPYIDKLKELVASLEAKGLVSASSKD